MPRSLRPTIPLRWALVLLCGASAVGCGCESPSKKRLPATPTTSLPKTSVPEFAPSFHRGICLAHNYQGQGAKGYGTERCDATITELKTQGTRWLSLTPFGFSSSTNATEISIPKRHSFPAAETDDRVVRTIRSAHQKGLSVLLKPHVWISGGMWRGDWGKGFSETQWQQWFASYEKFILHYAKIANDEKAAVLSIGVELSQSLARKEQWQALIAKIRSSYNGKLVYSANWDQVQNVPFWNRLDFVGVQFYPSISPDEKSPADQKLLRAAFDTLNTQRTSKPVLLTEVGYRSVSGAGYKPYEWPERNQRAPESKANGQADAYRVFFNTVAEYPWIEGVYIWKWFTDPDSNEEQENGFSPRGKEAQQILKQVYSRGL